MTIGNGRMRVNICAGLEEAGSEDNCRDYGILPRDKANNGVNGRIALSAARVQGWQ